MNRFLALIMVLTVTLSVVFSSCNKCKTCTYSYKFNGKDSTRAFAEECGNKKELDNYVESVNAAASADNGAEVTCTDN